MEYSEENDQKEIKKVSFLKASIYGCGEVGVSVGHSLFGLFFTTFLLEVSKLEASKAGTVLLIGQIWDAITTPIIGYLTDNMTRTRWGRRRPWLLFASVPYSLSFLALWQAWPYENQNLIFTYYLLTILLFNLTGNCIQIPYSALTADLVFHYNDAIILTRSRMACDIIGGVIASYTMSKLISHYYYPNGKINYAYGYMIFSIIGCIFFIIPPLIVFFFIREKPLPPKKEKDKSNNHKTSSCYNGLRTSIHNLFAVIKFKPYLILTLMYFLCWTTIQFTQSNMFLFYKHVVNVESQYQYIILLIQCVAAVCLFMWALLCEEIEKHYVFAFGMTIMACSCMIGFWVDSSWPIWSIYISVIPAGFGISTGYLIPWSMVPDIINAFEFTKGERKEGMFNSVFVLVQKLGMAFALAMHSYTLGWIGFNNSGEQTDDVKKIIRLMSSWIPFTGIMLSVIISLFYPLNSKKMKTVLNILYRTYIEMEEKRKKKELEKTKKQA